MSVDRLIWNHSPHGDYTARSGYHLALTISSHAPERVRGNSNGSSSGSQDANWKSLWKLKLPPKIIHFIWRACSESLPLGVELARRKIIMSPSCQRCNAPMETLMHVLTQCRGMDGIWKSQPFNLPNINPQDSMWTFFHLLRFSLDEDVFLLALVVCWKCWEIRNKDMHRSLLAIPPDIVLWSQRYLEAYKSAQTVQPPPPERTEQREQKEQNRESNKNSLVLPESARVPCIAAHSSVELFFFLSLLFLNLPSLSETYYHI